MWQHMFASWVIWVRQSNVPTCPPKLRATSDLDPHVIPMSAARKQLMKFIQHLLHVGDATPVGV